METRCASSGAEVRREQPKAQASGRRPAILGRNSGDSDIGIELRALLAERVVATKSVESDELQRDIAGGFRAKWRLSFLDSCHERLNPSAARQILRVKPVVAGTFRAKAGHDPRQETRCWLRRVVPNRWFRGRRVILAALQRPAMIPAAIGAAVR